jgi:hypothetical protein
MKKVESDCLERVSIERTNCGLIHSVKDYCFYFSEVFVLTHLSYHSDDIIPFNLHHSSSKSSHREFYSLSNKFPHLIFRCFKAGQLPAPRFAFGLSRLPFRLLYVTLTEYHRYPLNKLIDMCQNCGGCIRDLFCKIRTIRFGLFNRRKKKRVLICRSGLFKIQ